MAGMGLSLQVSSIRPTAADRKNWLLVGFETAGQRAVIIHTMPGCVFFGQPLSEAIDQSVDETAEFVLLPHCFIAGRIRSSPCGWGKIVRVQAIPAV